MIKRAAIALPTAAILSLSVATFAHAGQNATSYTNWVYNTSEAHGKATFKAYGEHLLVTDTTKDGHSAIGALEIGVGHHYFYWNRNGGGTTRDVNLSMPEGQGCQLTAFLGNWDGTVTGGIDWNSSDTISPMSCQA